jgi:hypothetical protein
MTAFFAMLFSFGFSFDKLPTGFFNRRRGIARPFGG